MVVRPSSRAFVAICERKALVLLDTTRWLQWGSLMRSLANHKDKGPAYFQRIANARMQLEKVVQQSYPMASVYVFGSSVVHQVWDGEADIDFTCIDTVAWGKNKWPPDERIAVLKCGATLGLLAKTSNVNAITLARVPILKYSGVVSEAVYPQNESEHRTQCTVVIALKKPVFTGEPLQQSMRLVEREVRAIFGVGSPEAIQQLTWPAPTGEEIRVECATCHDAVQVFVTLKTRARLGPAPLVSVKLASQSLLPECLGVDFDLSFRAFGLRNSYLLQRYMTAHPCVRPGAQLLKSWSKANGLNNSSAGWLCTYAFNVMWLHFLIHKKIVPFVVPDDIPTNPAEMPTMPSYSPIVMSDACVISPRRPPTFSNLEIT